MKRLACVSTIVLALTLSVAAGPTNLVVNGGFEMSPDPDPVLGYVFIQQGTTALTGWTVGGLDIDSVDVASTALWDPYEGAKSLDLNGRSPGWISQDIATEVGQWYELSFALSGNPGRPQAKDLAVTAGPVSDVVFSFTSPNTVRDMMWETHTLFFQADSTTTEISFLSVTPLELRGTGPVIDDVRVSAVPLPDGILLASLGASVVGWLRSRRLAH